MYWKENEWFEGCVKNIQSEVLLWKNNEFCENKLFNLNSFVTIIQI